MEHSEEFTCGNEMQLQKFNMVNRHLVLDASSCKQPETTSWGQVTKLLSLPAIFVCSHSKGGVGKIGAVEILALPKRGGLTNAKIFLVDL